MKPTRQQDSGFTIVELMIATLVFSMILTIVTAGVLSFTKRYSRAVRASSAQSTAQNIIDTATQAIQFGANATPDLTNQDSGYICMGGQYFKFSKTDGKYTGNSAQTGFSVGADGGMCTAPLAPRQLLAKNTRLAYFRVAPSNQAANVYDVEVTIAYGDDDLLCSPSEPGSCDPSGSAMLSYWHDDITCKSGAGSQFCAVSRLKTSVQERV